MEKKYGQRSIKEHEARGEVIPESGGEFSASRKHRIVMVKGATPFTSREVGKLIRRLSSARRVVKEQRDGYRECGS